MECNRVSVQKGVGFKTGAVFKRPFGVKRQKLTGLGSFGTMVVELAMVFISNWFSNGFLGVGIGVNWFSNGSLERMGVYRMIVYQIVTAGHGPPAFCTEMV